MYGGRRKVKRLMNLFTFLCNLIGSFGIANEGLETAAHNPEFYDMKCRVTEMMAFAPCHGS